MTKKLLLPCLAAGLVVLGLACDSASPVAPSGTVLTISASPNEISTTGSSVIRVTAVRANGTPVNPGTIVRLATTLGEIDEQAETDESGVARATLVGDGRIGTATVSARSGSAEEVSVEVMVGRLAANVSLQATPSSIPETGGTVELLASVRDSEGQPLVGATANFSTEIGRLDSRGAFLTTGPNGQVGDMLIVEEDDVNALASSARDFQVSVEVGGEGSVVTDNFSVRLEVPVLQAEFTRAVDNLTVRFNDASTINGEPAGAGELNRFWSFGDGASSQDLNPVHTYSAAGSYDVTLRVTLGRSESQVQKQVVVGDQ